MKNNIAVWMLCVFLLSCSPILRIKENKLISIANKNELISCFKTSCCLFYKHHKDVNKASAMLCINETLDAKQIFEGEILLSEIDLNLKIIYNDYKLIFVH